MLTSRNRRIRLAAFLALPLLAVSVDTPFAAQQPKEQVEKPKMSEKKEQKKKAAEDKKKPSGKFVPSEKVSPGKSLSFPTDI